jgi:(p)ppGpp synthase/HD superfamily hydrolase
MKNHRFRSQIESKVKRVFANQPASIVRLMKSLDQMIETHDSGFRRNGEFKKSHELAILAIILVYCGITDVDLLDAVLRHDFLEDYSKLWSKSKITKEATIETSRIVDCVTEPDKAEFVTIEEFHLAKFEKVVRGGIKPIMLKIADRFHNLSTLTGSRQKQLDYIEETETYVLPLAKEHHFLYDELKQLINHQRRRVKRLKK